jgi:hypothetical protein
MKRVGIIAENSNDYEAIKGLLAQTFEEVEFCEILKGKNGSNLDDKNSNAIVRLLDRQFRAEDLDFILYIRDLDGLIDEKEKINARKARFQRFKKTVSDCAIFMLNIYEIETLILADFETFKQQNKNTDWNFDPKNAAITLDSKGVLYKFCGYGPSINKVIPTLSIQNIQENHKHFKAFIKHFEKMLLGEKYRFTPL